jgi:thiol-disulfide isomerase/thioredoxin
MNDETRESLTDLWNRWGCFGTLALAALFIGVAAWIVGRDHAPRTGTAVTSVAFLDAAGGRHTLAEYAGKVVVVDVWATWCPPCRASLPEIAALQAASGDRYAVLPISVDDGGFKVVEAFLARQGGPLRAMQAYVPLDRDALDPFGPISGIPTTIIVGADGTLRTRWSGYAPGRTASELKAALGK